MVGSEVYSSEIKKTEVLMENFRRAIGKFTVKNICENYTYQVRFVLYFISSLLFFKEIRY